MSLFNRKKQPAPVAPNIALNIAPGVVQSPVPQSSLAELVLNYVNDGVAITNRAAVVQYANPAIVSMLGYTVEGVLGLDASLLVKVESLDGHAFPENENPILNAIHKGQSLERYRVVVVSGATKKHIPVSVSIIPINNQNGDCVFTFRDITKELAEEGEQAEFISTASHEMRTPVASIEGYLSLALNPQTATIDERARAYLNSAHAASQHLGQLFRDLLDVTKLDDGHLRPHFEPVEMMGLIKQISDGYRNQFNAAKLNYQFGSRESESEMGGTARRLDQVVYGYVDVNFMREIMGNLIDNAIKYTPEGGSVYINVLGDGDRALINVTDTGMGISSDDLGHIFQKFYRADNSDTRTIGGTGLGLYLVKQRVEAMGGRVWAESAFGEGSTFFVSLPRITGEEYEKRMIAKNNGMDNNVSQGGTQ